MSENKKIFRAEALALVELIEEDVMAAIRARVEEMGAPAGRENWQKWNATQQGKLALLADLREIYQKRGPYEVIAVAEGTAL